MIYSFKGFIPVIHESSFVHPLAAVTGNVIIGKNCYIGPGAAIRGDWGEIILEDGVAIESLDNNEQNWNSELSVNQFLFVLR